MSILCSNGYQMNVFYDALSGICVTRMPLWSHSWSLHGLYTPLHYWSRPFMKEEAAEKLGVHHHHFGEERLWVPMLQVCIECPSLWNEVGAVCLSERMWLTCMKYVPVDSGEAQTIEQVWKEYFTDRLQWWDNRVDKVSLGLPVSWC
jgi:hypothetical protein